MCDDSTSSQVIMHLLRKCCQIMLTPQPQGPGAVRGDEWEGKECVYIMHMSHLPAFQQLLAPKSFNSGDAADTYMSQLIFIMCAIAKKSKLLFTLEPFSLR